MLALKNIQILYDRAIEAVRDVSLEVPTGQIVALLGSNGAGKSTILKAISGVLYQEDGEIMSGSIQLEGEQISGRTPRDIVEKGVLQVPEGRAPFATLTDMPPFGQSRGWLRLPRGGLRRPERAGGRLMRPVRGSFWTTTPSI